MNYDMVGSPNYFLGVYDADQSSYAAPVVVPPGSEAIEDVYESFYTAVGQPYDDTEFSGRSDYQAFIEAGIPSGGLFTGAEVVKTAEQQAIWGGTVGAQFDPCYHQACDTYANNSDAALEVNSDLVAFAMLTFAYSTESVNGVAGRTRSPARRSTCRPRPVRRAPAPRDADCLECLAGGGLGVTRARPKQLTQTHGRGGLRAAPFVRLGASDRDEQGRGEAAVDIPGRRSRAGASSHR